MAFHNPDPKMREIERNNARLRAKFFNELFGRAWRVLHRVLSRFGIRQRCRRKLETEGVSHEPSKQRSANV